MSDRDGMPEQAVDAFSSDEVANLGGATVLRPFIQVTGGTSRIAAPVVVSFDRKELGQILQLYGRKVSEGEWRDYALDFMPLKAAFSVFRRTSEVPLYMIEKCPNLARKQGAYSVVSSNGMILRRGQELTRVLAVLDRKIRLVGG